MAAVPIVLMSGTTRQQRQKPGEVAGFLDKPITYDALIEVVKTFCGQPPPVIRPFRALG